MKLAIIPAILVANLAATIAAPTLFNLPNEQTVQVEPPAQNPAPPNHGRQVTDGATKIPGLTVGSWAPVMRPPSSKAQFMKYQGPDPSLFDANTLGKTDPGTKRGSSLTIQFPKPSQMESDSDSEAKTENTVPEPKRKKKLFTGLFSRK